jgi:hypothetical protein
MSAHRLFPRRLHARLPAQIRRPCARRALSTPALEPVLQGLARSLAETQPCFPVRARDVRILAEPREFYASVLVSRHHDLQVYTLTRVRRT